jgi:hypothetical protein
MKEQNPEYKLFAIFYNQKFVLHTVFEVDPSNMPVQYGKEEF